MVDDTEDLVARYREDGFAVAREAADRLRGGRWD